MIVPPVPLLGIVHVRALAGRVRHARKSVTPGGLGQAKGYPVRVASTARSRDQAAQQRLWAESERLTGVTYPV